MNNQQNQPQMRIPVNPATDLCICSCGSKDFLPFISLAKGIPPIIGSKPIYIPLSQKFMCTNCGESVEKSKTIKEKQTEELENAKGQKSATQATKVIGINSAGGSSQDK